MNVQMNCASQTQTVMSVNEMRSTRFDQRFFSEIGPIGITKGSTYWDQKCFFFFNS